MIKAFDARRLRGITRTSRTVTYREYPLSDTDVVSADVALPQIRNMLTALRDEADRPDPNAAISIMENLLGADSEEELFRRQEAGTVSSKDHLNRPFRLLPENITWKKSASVYVEQGGFPVYALLRVQDMASGDTFVIDSGSGSVVATLYKLSELDDENVTPDLGKRPFERFRNEGGKPLMFVGKPVGSGNTVVLLQPVITGPVKSGKK